MDSEWNTGRNSQRVRAEWTLGSTDMVDSKQKRSQIVVVVVVVESVAAAFVAAVVAAVAPQ